MSAGIVFFFQENDLDVFSGRQIDLDCWRYACKACDIYKMCMINLLKDSDKKISINDSEMDFSIYRSLEEFELKHPNDEKLYFETPWTFPKDMKPIKLQDLVHPKDVNVWYIFGPATGFVPKNTDDKTWVTIPQNGRGAMHSVHASILALHDRFMKLNEMRK